MDSGRLTKDELRQYILSVGADLVGFASVDRFKNAPEGHHPVDYLPEAKTVVTFAKQFPNTVLMRGPVTSYHKMIVLLERELDIITYKAAIFIERHGGLAVTINADRPYYEWDPEKRYGRGEISHKHAAELAGLGRIGKNSLLITPEYGNRVQLGSVITDLEFEPDPMIKEELCPKDCTLCIEICPVHAISEWGKVDQKLCRSHMYLTIPKGYVIEGCNLCRMVCPIGVKQK